MCGAWLDCLCRTAEERRIKCVCVCGGFRAAVSYAIRERTVRALVFKPLTEANGIQADN